MYLNPPYIGGSWALTKEIWVGFTALRSKDEEIFVHHIIAVSTWGFPFSNLDLRLLFKDYLERTSCEKKCFKTNIPGEEWVKSFLKHTSQPLHWVENVSED